MNDLISVIVPVYNVEPYLRRCMDSIINQNYTNLEIILVDDGSTDKSGLICDEYVKKDSRIKVIHKENGGVSSARNIGLQNSSGEYIIFLDPDDEIKSEMLFDMKNTLIKTDSDMACCAYKHIFTDKKIVRFPENDILEQIDIFRALVCDLGFFQSIWNKLFKRSLLLDSNADFIKFDETIHMSEDYLWLCNVLQNCKRVYCIKQPYYLWYVRKDSAVYNNENRIDEKSVTQVEAYRKIANILKQIDKKIYHIFFKEYLGVIKEKMILAYCSCNDIYLNKLKNIAVTQIKEYRICSFRDLLFKCKYYILYFAILIKADKNFIKKLNQIKGKRDE